jgi:hypothetical protein
LPLPARSWRAIGCCGYFPGFTGSQPQLLLAGVGLYSYGFSEDDPKWNGRGLMCLNGPLILGALAGILVIVGVATDSLTRDTLNRLYRDEAVIFGVYSALIAINLVIDARRRSQRMKEKTDLTSADNPQAFF